MTTADESEVEDMLERMQQEAELKPCPFCGSQPHVLKSMGTILCGSDDCFGPETTAGNYADSVVQWNRRA